ncbi:unnamed protein product, partial [Rotaria sp. Silwood1]
MIAKNPSEIAAQLLKLQDQCMNDGNYDEARIYEQLAARLTNDK